KDFHAWLVAEHVGRVEHLHRSFEEEEAPDVSVGTRFLAARRIGEGEGSTQLAVGGSYLLFQLQFAVHAWYLEQDVADEESQKHPEPFVPQEVHQRADEEKQDARGMPLAIHRGEGGGGEGQTSARKEGKRS